MCRSSVTLRLMIGACLLCGISLRAAPDYSTYARLLQTYVAEDGVRYEAWAKHARDVGALGAVVAELGQADLAALSTGEQKALYINLYNAAMLQVVFEHYPIKSVKEIGLLPFSVFKQKFISLGGKQVSLNAVEKEILLKQYFDPRIHFAVNCASGSCPPLRAEPYVGERLKVQLNEQTRLFAESDRAAQVDTKEKETAYSELFKWYADDFDVKSPAEFLNRYREENLPVHHSVQWIDYDWSLNQAK
ncbi:MAG: hypothetical protein ACI8Z5_000030 [Lentimonas sp.]|jgi:hypothetical protein